MRDFNDDKVEVVLINGRRAFVSRENIAGIFFDYHSLFFVLIAVTFYSFLPVNYALGGIAGAIVRFLDAAVTGFVILSIFFVVCVSINFFMTRFKIRRKFYFTLLLISVTALVEYLRQFIITSYFQTDSTYISSASARITYAILLELIFAYFVIDKVKSWVEETDRSFVLGPQPKLAGADTPETTPKAADIFSAADTQQKVRFGNAVFLAREVLMIEAQQHYIDVTTPTKVHRLRFRLKDATALMPHHLGWLANRSTWVAYDLISAVKPISDGRASLMLFSGEMVVVPRGRQSDLTRLNAILQQRDAAQKSSNA